MLDDLKKKLKSKDITGVYAFCGDEEYTKDFYVDKLRAFVADAGEYGRTAFGKSDISPAELEEAINTVSFYSENKVIEINSFPITQPPAVLSRYIDILSDIPSGVAVILIYRADEFDPELAEPKNKGKNDFVDFMNNGCVFVNFARESGAKLDSWIEKHFEAKNVSIRSDALRFLPEYCGNDMYILSGEIDKLCSFYNGEQLTVADVTAVCCANTDYRIYDIVNLLSSGNATGLKRAYDGLIYEKTKPELILGTVSGYFADLSLFKTAFDENKSQRELREQLGYRDFQISRYAALAKKMTDSFISYAVNECIETDCMIKTQSCDPYTVIEIMLYRIMAYGKSNR